MKMTRGQSVSPLTLGERRGRALSTAIVLFHQAIAARLGMSSAEWKCLGFLEEYGSLTPGRLAALSGFTTGAITGIVDRLERAGYVRRTRHAGDRRSMIVHPLKLAKIKRRTAPIFASLGRTMNTVTARYTAKELALIDDYLDRITRALQQETERLK